MHQNTFDEYEIPYEMLVAMLTTLQDRGGRVRIRIDSEYRVDPEKEEKRPLEVLANEIILYGELLELSPNRYNFLRSFAIKDCVEESVISQNVYHNQTANHRKIKKIADALTKELGEKILFKYKKDHWTIIFNQT